VIFMELIFGCLSEAFFAPHSAGVRGDAALGVASLDDSHAIMSPPP
jgi:hypothetical protein